MTSITVFRTKLHEKKEYRFRYSGVLRLGGSECCLRENVQIFSINISINMIKEQ